MHYYFFLRLENFRFKIFFFLHINKKNSQGKISQMNLDLENMNNNLSQENSTPVPVSDNDDSLSIVDLCLDNRVVTETSAGDVAETSARGVEETNNEEQEQATLKRPRTIHPLWTYFSWSADKKFAFCNLCRTQYSKTTGISTIKCHFETHHKGDYNRLQSTLGV